METIEDILKRAQQIRDETAIGKNSATRVGGVLVDICQHTQSLISELNNKLGKNDVINSNNIAKGAVTYEKLGKSSVSWESLAPELKSYIYTMSGFPEYLLEMMVKGIEFVQNDTQLSMKVIMADGKSEIIDVPRLTNKDIDKILL